MRNSDMPAMPSIHCTTDSLDADVMVPDQWAGLSKREHFAALAFQGLLASCADKVQSPYAMANDAVACADALLAELERTGGES